MATALLVTCAATLLESAPFVLAAAVLAGTPLRRSGWMVPYLGCGCGTGPSARSLPAAAAVCAIFGPFVAAARLAAGTLIARLLPHACNDARGDGALSQLLGIAPAAAIGACVSLFAPVVLGLRPSPPIAFGAGALCAILMSPCGISAAAFAASLRVTLPVSAAGFLCAAGIVDVRTWFGTRRVHVSHDVLGYLLLTAACALAAGRGGAGLVHPRIAAALWPCAGVSLWLAHVHRRESCWPARIAPAIMLAGSVLSVPPPQYYASETTLAGAFPGERLDFTGSVTRSANETSLVRYAITCCRADAAPIAVRIADAPHWLAGWVHARGTLVDSRDGLELKAELLQPIAPPTDPFVYR